MGPSWKPKLLGILSIVVAVSGAVMGYLKGIPIDFPTLIAAVMAGIGLLHARQVDVTSEQQGLK